MIFLILLLTSLNINSGTSHILIERQEKWTHPVLDVFKKHEITLNKIRYYKDGTCPVFFAEFKVSPKTNDFSTIYQELLKANSNFPYALVDKKNKTMINVGWSKDVPSKKEINIGNIFPFPNCDEGSNTMSFTFKMTPKLKKSILQSPYKVTLRRADGKNLIAYLYAEDGESEPITYSQRESGEEKETTQTQGHFYIYLYDPATDKFFPKRIAPMYSWQPISMDFGRSAFMVLPHSKENQSDVLLISIYYNSIGDLYEAYGFSEDLSTLKKYRFEYVKKQYKSISFYGVLDSYKNKIHGYRKHENIIEDENERGVIDQYRVKISDAPGEIVLLNRD